MRKYPPAVLLTVAVVISAFICAAVWPGFMANDPMRVLRAARFGMTDNMQPAATVYLQKLFDSIYPGPGLLLAFQNTLFMVALAVLINSFRLSVGRAVALMVAVVMLPPVIGNLIACWKDTTIMALLATAFVCLRATEQRYRSGLWWTGVLLSGFAAAFRLNGIGASIPLLFYAFSIRNRHVQEEQSNLPLFAVAPTKAAALTAVTALILSTAVAAFNSTRLPDFKPLSGSLVAVMQVFDLIGMSHFTGETLLPACLYEHSRPYEADKLGYFPHCVDFSFDSGQCQPRFTPLNEEAFHSLDTVGTCTNASGEPFTTRDLTALWWHAIEKHPLSFARHRAEAALSLLCLNRTRVHYITEVRVLPNELGVKYQGNASAALLVIWVALASYTPIAWPWVYYLAGAILLARLIRNKPPHWEQPAVLIASSFGMLLLLLPVTVAADYRYHAWSLCAIVFAFLLAIFSDREQQLQSEPSHQE